ncbi:MAG: Branched-chain amino acid transport system substrate-binding protein, partial [Frankiales bacterium]|nr:Branched-chain amino acid transport system substrate-binding protein [Frankiales bacterium]
RPEAATSGQQLTGDGLTPDQGGTDVTATTGGSTTGQVLGPLPLGGTTGGTRSSSPPSSTTGGSTTTSGSTTGGTATGGTTTSQVARGSTVGVTPTSVKIGLFVPKTGAAPVPPTIDAQAQNYWDFVKRKVGGIYGRNVTIKIYDTKSTEADARAAVQQAVADGIFAAITLDRISVEGKLVSELHKAGIPHLVNQMPHDQAIPSDAFYIGTDQVNNGRQIADYMAHTLKVTKVGFVGEADPTAYPARNAFVAEAKRLGLQVVHNEVIDGMGNQFLAEAQKLANDKAQAMWMYVAPNNAINLSVEAKNDGYHPVWVSSSIAWGFNLAIAPANQANGALEGARSFSPWGGLQDPRYKTYNAQNTAGRTNQDKDIGLPAWGYGQIIAAAMKAAGPELGRNSFRAALQNLSTGAVDVVTGAPMCWPPLDFRGGKRYGSGDRTIVMRVKGSGAASLWETESDYRSVY